MTWDEVFSLVCSKAAAVLSIAGIEDVDPETSLSGLGANSLDRMDIVVLSQDELDISVPAAAFADVRNLRQLVDVLHAHCS